MSRSANAAKHFECTSRVRRRRWLQNSCLNFDGKTDSFDARIVSPISGGVSGKAVEPRSCRTGRKVAAIEELTSDLHDSNSALRRDRPPARSPQSARAVIHAVHAGMNEWFLHSSRPRLLTTVYWATVCSLSAVISLNKFFNSLDFDRVFSCLDQVSAYGRSIDSHFMNWGTYTGPKLIYWYGDLAAEKVRAFWFRKRSTPLGGYVSLRLYPCAHGPNEIRLMV